MVLFLVAFLPAGFYVLAESFLIDHDWPLHWMWWIGEQHPMERRLPQEHLHFLYAVRVKVSVISFACTEVQSFSLSETSEFVCNLGYWFLHVARRVVLCIF
jgi:hypothetical protein